MTEQTTKRGKGFAAIPKERLTEISSKGGKAAHSAGVAHNWTPDTAKEAAYKGVAARRVKKAEREAEAAKAAEG